MNNSEVQNIAKQTIDYIKTVIMPNNTKRKKNDTQIIPKYEINSLKQLVT